MEFTAEQLEELGTAYYRGRAHVCPNCGKVPSAERHPGINMRTVPVRFKCQCGRTGTFTPVPATDPYTEAEKRRVLAGYGIRRVEPCPRDGVPISFEEGESIPDRNVTAKCPWCGRHS
jgi:hypothetical protein